MEKKLCKKEQMSNWENRPLRYSQEHYGAMDAWILGEIMVKMVATGKGKRINLDKFVNAVGEKVEKPPKKAKGPKEENKEREPKNPKEPKESAEPRQLREKKPDPSKIKDYERQIDYHTKKLAEFKDLL
jgi:hypothetical protein